MSKKLKIVDSNKDNFIYGDPDIIDINFMSSYVDNENSQIIQRSEILMNEEIPARAIIDINSLFLNHETTIIIPQDSESLYQSEGHRNNNFYSVESEYMFDSLSYNNFIRDLNETQIPAIYLSKEDIYNTKEYNQYSHFRSTINKEKMLNFRSKLEPFYNTPDSATEAKYREFFFGKKYDLSIGSSNSSAFPYYVKINLELNSKRLVLDTLDSSDVMLYDKVVNDFQFATKTNYSFEIDGASADLGIVDFLDLVKDKSFQFKNERITVPHQPGLSPISEASKRWAASSILSKKALGYTRDFNDIYNLDQCEYEILYYKIEKYVGGVAINNPSQVYYFNNVSDGMMFYDSQVKLSGTYTYALKACFLIHGSQYSHTVINESVSGGIKRLVIDTTIKPSLKLVEISLFEKTVSVYKNPPIPPGVHFINKSNSKNQIKMILQLESGEFIAPLITSKSEDIQIAEKLKPVKSVTSDPRYLFRFSDQAGRFEVFKSRSMMQNYSSYETSYVAENKNGHPHVVLTDKILPNRKYYYFFRTIDDYGYFSNPTPIYEVELLKDSDSSKIVVKTVPLYDEKSVLFESDQKFGQFFQIKPAFQHIQLDYGDGLFDFSTYKRKLNSFGLGTEASNPLWGKKFKFRITSNNTGKKIDFNVIFDIVKEQSEENLE